MPLNVIENNMITKNTIRLQPKESYVYASSFCKDYNSLGVEESGTYGSLKSKTNKSENFTRIVKNYDESNQNYSVDDSNSFKANHTSIDQQNTSDIRFGVEKVRSEYLLDAPGYYKKKALKNLYNFYRENIEHRVINPNWGFTNYNTINFFTVDSSINRNIASNSFTHKNCIVYPNYYDESSNFNDYDFEHEELTLSFYINPRSKNKENYRFNPGCILCIPYIVSIYLIEGSSRDINGLTDSFKLVVAWGDDANKDFSDLKVKTDDSSDYLTSSNVNGKTIFTSDNILSYNNWHNVSITLKNSIDLVGNNEVEKKRVEVFVDGSLLESFLIEDFDFANRDYNSFITVGNKFEILSSDNLARENIEDVYNKCFGYTEVNSNFVGSYINKHVTNRSVKRYNASISVDEFTNNLISPETDYFTKQSNAFNGEIHDLRIYKKALDENTIKKSVYESCILDFGEEDLLFCLPVYYYDAEIKKKGYVTLSDQSNKNILCSGLVNQYITSNTGFTDVCVENFIVEFKKKTFPNFIIGGTSNIDKDPTYDIFSKLANVVNIDDQSRNYTAEYFQKGKSIDELITKIYYGEIGITGDFSAWDENILYNNITYKNNLILPNDNGLQTQNYLDVKNYYTNYEGFFHKDDNSEIDYSFVSSNKIHKEKSAYLGNNQLISESLNDPFNEDSIRQQVDFYESDFDGRDTYSFSSIRENINEFSDIDSEITFKESYDKFKNISLSNFYNEKYNFLDGNTQTNEFIINIFSTFTLTVGTTTSIPNSNKVFFEDNNNLFKSYCNPATRLLLDYSENSFGDNSASIGEKLLEDDDGSIVYFSHEMPLYTVQKDLSENFSNSFCISTQMFRKSLERESVEIYDSDLGGTGGAIKIKLKDNNKGGMYRSDCLTKVADWNTVGHCLYKEGVITVLHPSLYNFGCTNYKIDFKFNTNLNVFELNLPAYSGYNNSSKNTSYIEDLRLDSSPFNSDEDFVYISDINLHDENLNIIAKAKLTNPFAKKDSDSVVFRLKMDF